MGQCNKDITPLLTHWSYIFLALTHWYVLHKHQVLPYVNCCLIPSSALWDPESCGANEADHCLLSWCFMRPCLAHKLGNKNRVAINCFIHVASRHHSSYGLHQWEEALHSNASSHWLRILRVMPGRQAPVAGLQVEVGYWDMMAIHFALYFMGKFVYIRVL